MKRILSLLIILQLLYSCAPSITVRSDYDRQADFKKYKTYYLSTAPQEENPQYPMYDNELNRTRMQNAIEREMASRGYVVNENNPDLKVDFHVTIIDKTDVHSYHTNRYRYWDDYEVQSYQYTEGTLVVHLVDGKEERLVWQGSAASILRPQAKDPETRINQAVSQIFEEYPHKAKGRLN